MKKIQRWFNRLPVQQQKLTLFGFCVVFAVLLLLSIWHSDLKMNTGSIVQPRIKNDTLKIK